MNKNPSRRVPPLPILPCFKLIPGNGAPKKYQTPLECESRLVGKKQRKTTNSQKSGLFAMRVAVCLRVRVAMA